MEYNSNQQVTDSPEHSTPPAEATKGMGLRERNKADKLARIKKAAKQLFEKQGYEATTTKEIADAAGVAAGTIFLYAKTKDELLYLIFEEDIAGIRDRAYNSVPESASLIDGVYIIFSELFRYYNASPELARGFVRRFVFIDPSMSERYMSFSHTTFDQLARLVVRSQERGETRKDLDPMLVVTNLFAIYRFATIFFLQSQPLELDRGLLHIRQSLELLHAGLSKK